MLLISSLYRSAPLPYIQTRSTCLSSGQTRSLWPSFEKDRPYSTEL